MNLKNIIIFILILAGIYGIYIYKQKSILTANIAPQLEIVPEVPAIQATKNKIAINYEYPGKVAGFREVEVKSQVEGILLKKNFEAGKLVNKDDLLFIVDQEPFEITLKKSEAQLKNAQANLDKLSKTWNRVKILFKKNAVSAEEKDEAFLQVEQAEGDVESAKADVNTAKINLNYTSIRAPITGMISEEIFSEGNLINKDSIVTKITQLNPVYINFSYPETDYKLHDQLMDSSNQNSIVKIKLSNGKFIEETGKIDFTDSVIDSNTSSIQSRAAIDNSKKELIPGQFVKIVIEGVSKDSIVIPERSIIQSVQGAIVYCIDSDNKVVAKHVELGELTKDGYIIEKGIDKGDLIITEGIMKISPGQKVNHKLNVNSITNN